MTELKSVVVSAPEPLLDAEGRVIFSPEVADGFAALNAEIRRLRALGLAQLAELKNLTVAQCLVANGSVSGAEALYEQRKREWEGGA